MIVPLLNKNSCILMASAALINILFFFLHNSNVYFAITQAHGQVGYNIYTYNSVELNPALTEHMERAMREEQQLIDYDRVRDIDFGPPTESFPINDTVGYGVLLGLLWKITDSLKFIDMQILQIILFVLLMPLYYHLALLLFGNTFIAFVCGIAHLCFFPLIAYNVMPVRDVWAYYGLLVLAYAVCANLYGSISWLRTVLCAIFFSACLWMRPTLFFALIMLSLYVWLMNSVRISKRSILPILGVPRLGVLWGVAIALFWLPYVRFNLMHYNRCVVSPAGQSLLEGLGEIPNPWGHKLNDEYVAEYIGANYGLKYGAPEFDEAAMTEFKACVRQNPLHYATTLLYRLPDVLLPGLQWIFYTDSPYAGCNGIKEKLSYAFSSCSSAIMFVLRQCYMRLYILIAWIGMWLLWRRKQYKVFWLITVCLLAGLTTFPSHIEYRYLVPFYWVISLAVGYAACCFFNLLRHTKVD